MKAGFYILVCMLLGTVRVLAGNDLLSEAETAYKAKHYRDAIAKYEELVKSGKVSYKLYYNLGNAYYRNNQLGKAIYNYELARKLNPSDEDVNVNLDIANSKTVDKIDAKTNFFAGVLKAKLVNSLSTTQWAWLSILSLCLALGLWFIFILSSHPFLKRLGFFSGSLVFVVFICSMVLGFIALNDKHRNSFAIVTAKESNIYNEPQNSDKHKFSLHEGTKVKVLESNPEWTSIKLENGNEGWVKTQDVGLF